MAIYTRNTEGELIPLDIPAIKGKDGITPNITVGEVTTLPAGEKATVNIGGTTESPVLNFSIPKGIGNSEKLLLKYTHTSNRVIQPISIDFDSGIFTCETPHELKNGDKLILDFIPIGEFNQTKILKELFDFNWTTWYFMIVEVVSNTEFKIKNNATNKYLTYNKSNTPNLDFTAFRFQLANDLVLDNLNLKGFRKLKFRLNFLTVSQTYSNAITVLKLKEQNHPFKINSFKFRNWVDSDKFIYPNRATNGEDHWVYGQVARFRNDIVENVITIKEHEVLKNVKMSSIGVTETFTTHDNNIINKNYTFDTICHGVGYEDGNTFIDSIIIPMEMKILNGSIVEIYSLEEE